MIEFFIPFKPVPWTVPRLRGRIWYNPRNKAKRDTQRFIAANYSGPIIDKRLSLLFEFYFTPPKSATIAMKAKMLARTEIPTACDLTNLQKFYEDCLKGIVIKDDRYTGYVQSRKWYGPKNLIHITVLDYVPAA
jgi:Holliday junction resolvase RusA-like endonuclease